MDNIPLLKLHVPGVLCVLLAIVIVACTTQTTPAPTPASSPAGSEPVQDYAAFTRELQAGASCEDLFELRNSIQRSIDPASADIERMNEDLRPVGCFLSSSTRTAQEQANNAPAPTGPGFTVMEYRLYRGLIDTPMSISEEQVLRSIGKRYGIPSEEVRRAANKVQETLSRNGWFETPESEIRRASDWQGERP
jgi:hypothetical protein